MKESIKQLIQLQQKDADIDRVKAEIEKIPAAIEALKAEIQQTKAQFEDSKKELTQFQMKKKTAELDLDNKEQSIRKHSSELNQVKSNDAYKALLGEIEKAKQEMSATEDVLLGLMDQIESAQKEVKKSETTFQEYEKSKQLAIQNLESEKKRLEDSVQQKKTERDATAAQMDATLIAQYDRLRQNKRSNPIVPIKSEQCGGCHMKVNPVLLLEIRKNHRLVTCESCSRIVYLEDVLNPAVKA